MFRHLYAPSTLLPERQFEQWCASGRVIEQDQRGPKVIILDNGDFLKIFRARHIFSGACIYSHARRFYRNALRLAELKIPTVTVKALYHFDQPGQTAVLYQPIPGHSIRDLVRQDVHFVEKSAEKLGKFLAKMHLRGVHFHSLHTGNILFLPNQEFGLIDISDMSIYRWPLMCITRYRSFKRLCKYKEDIMMLGQGYWERMLREYFRYSFSSPLCQKKIQSCNPFVAA
ncbi:MAG: hypothetical protein B7X95_05935 [Methylophilaceae bacterium 17-44-8]|nr:MAG: hypothetical protein B7Y48_01920 [Methylophilales bacterium 28-44-11]OZA05582.1 MAG: hypothetical protein B7X95_05935 [Methylophilaceae bacterium 17-44-8]